MGRHAQQPQKSRARVRLVIPAAALVLALSAVVGWRVMADTRLTSESTASEGTAATATSCDNPVVVDGPLAEAAAPLSAALAAQDAEHPCLVAAGAASGAEDSATDDSAASAGPPDAALTWLTPGGDTSDAVGTSPLMLAMPTEVATALGWPKTPLDAELLRAMVSGAKSPEALGFPEWGQLRILSPDPASDSLGTLSWAALTTTVNGGPMTGAPSYAAPTPGDLGVIKLEHAFEVAPVGTQTLPVGLTPEQARAAASAYITTEYDLATYNASEPSVPLAGFYIGAGSVTVPVGLVPADGIDEDRAAQVAEFTALTRSEDGQAALRGTRLRGLDGTAPTAALVGVDPQSAVAPPASVEAAALKGAAALWSGMTLRISTLAVIDTSGSMKEALPGDTGSKMELVSSIAQQSFAYASPKARSGVWFFNTGAGGSPRIDTSVGLNRNDKNSGDLPHVEAVTRAVATAKAAGDTPLYQAILEAHRYATQNYDPEFFNQVVVLTDGREDSTDTMTAEEAAQQLTAQADPQRPVRLVIVSLDSGAHLAEMAALAEAVGGKSVSAGTLAQIPAALEASIFSTD